MHDLFIDQMVRKLTPVLKDPPQARKILNRFWTTKMALVWDIQDIHRAANERKRVLTDREPTHPHCAGKPARIVAVDFLRIELWTTRHQTHRREHLLFPLQYTKSHCGYGCVVPKAIPRPVLFFLLIVEARHVFQRQKSLSLLSPRPAQWYLALIQSDPRT